MLLSLKKWWQSNKPPINANRNPLLNLERDTSLTVLVMIALTISAIFVYSATIAMNASPKFASYSEFHFLSRHLLSIFLGICAMLIVREIKLSTWQKIAPKLFIISLIALILVLIPNIGRSVGGARRWISFGIMTFQPSELIKLATILYGANYIVRKIDKMHLFKQGILPLTIAVSIVGALLLLEPDMGAFMVVALIAGGILFLGGANGRLFLVLIVVSTCVFSAIIWFSPWRRDRIFAYLSPWSDQHAQDKGYQLVLSLIAFGRGEWWGSGLGASIQKLNYLPEVHTDFILAVIGEELGFMGLAGMVILFFLIAKKAFLIGRTAIQFQQNFSGLVAQGVGLWFGGQAFINMGVNLGLLPTKGLTLPLISYGGSAIIINCIAIGILMRVDYENRKIMRGEAI
jgi:cell division protein FtsW